MNNGADGGRRNRMHSLRLEDGIPMLRCDECWRRHRSASFWPITAEFWHLDRPGGLRMCRACWRIDNTARMAIRRKNGGEQLSRSEAAYRRHYRERKARAA
jgi:hypothetical protein